jgi:hypothetical protein
MQLSSTGILEEDIHCQFYSEAFVLLPISDGYTNVTLTRSQVLSPQLPELISPEEHAQIKEHAGQTRQTLAALEATIQRKSAINQQPYVDLRVLSDTMSTEGNKTTPTAW